MSIKIEGNERTAENVIKDGASNELLYNDKEVLLKENFVGLGLLPPDLKKAEEWRVVVENNGAVNYNVFTVPEDGWIVKVDLFYSNSLSEVSESYFIDLTPIGGQLGTYDPEMHCTPGQYYIGSFIGMDNERRSVAIPNLNCPYPVKKGQSVGHGKLLNFNDTYNVTVTFAPCMSV